MGLGDDYVDEMDALSPEQIDAVLSGRHPDPAAARAATLVADLRNTLVEEPSPQVAGRHVEAMIAARVDPGRSRRSEIPVLTSRRRKRGIGGLALAAVLVMGSGLAAAVTPPGQPAVTLPDQALDEAREDVGQDAQVADEASAHGQAVTELAQDPTREGCDKGLAVAAVASSRAGEEAPELPDSPCTRAGESRGEADLRSNGEEGGGASVFGQATAEEAKADGKAFGQKTATEAQADGAGFGTETATQASRGKVGGSQAEPSGGATGGGPPADTPGGPPGG